LNDTLPPDPFSYNPPNVWLTSFWGFRPESWGFVGFTQESDRRSFLKHSRPGCLVVVYVTKGSKHDLARRGRIAGFLQMSDEIGHASKFMPGDAFAVKERDPKQKGKWNFGVRAIRAWRVASDAPPLIEEFAPLTFGSATAQYIGGRGMPFDPSEALNLLDIEVFEVPIYRGRSTFDTITKPLAQQLKPSRAVPRSTSPYTVDEPDGPKKLYILKLRGNIAYLLDRPEASIAKKIVIKIGYSMDPNVRCYAFNHAMPKCAFEWEVYKTDEGIPRIQITKLLKLVRTK
jgi:hypothetical protein